MKILRYISENAEKLFLPIIKSITYANTLHIKSMTYKLFQSFQLYLQLTINQDAERPCCFPTETIGTRNTLTA